METTQHETRAARRDQEARALVGLYAERVAATKAFADADSPTAAQADHVIALGDRLDEACEAFRLRHYPDRARVAVGLYAVFTVSATGRSIRNVLDLFDEYHGATAAAA